MHDPEWWIQLDGFFFSYWCFWRAKYCRNYFSIFFHHFRDIIGSLIDHNSLKFIRYVHIRLEKAINLIFFLPSNKIKKSTAKKRLR